MKKYRSKIGLEVLLPILLIIGTVAVIMVSVGQWLTFAFCILVLAFAVHMLLTTWYTIDDTTLHVHCGFLINMKIPVSAIKQVSETKNPLSSPAASLDRLAIRYNDHDLVMVSPKDKAGFIHHLTAVNPRIKVTGKHTAGVMP